MRIIIILFCLVLTTNLYSQLTLKDRVLWVNEISDNSQVILVNPDSVDHVIFNGSRILELDSAWAKFKNVELITFTRDALIPKEVNFLESVDKVHFSNYSSEIAFPADFPFETFVEVGLSNVRALPSELNAFCKMEGLFLFMIEDNVRCEEIVKSSSLKVLTISEVENLDLTLLCNLYNLEKLELSFLTFKSDFADFRCFQAIKSLTVENTNMRRFEAIFLAGVSIRLVDNLLSIEEVQRVIAASQISNVIVKN